MLCFCRIRIRSTVQDCVCVCVYCVCTWNDKQMEREREKSINNEKPNTKTDCRLFAIRGQVSFVSAVLLLGIFYSVVFVAVVLKSKRRSFWQAHVYWSSIYCPEFKLVSGLETEWKSFNPKIIGYWLYALYAMCMLGIDLWPMGDTWTSFYTRINEHFDGVKTEILTFLSLCLSARKSSSIDHDSDIACIRSKWSSNAWIFEWRAFAVCT